MNSQSDTTKLSCYVDKETYQKFKEKAAGKGLSISAYLRFLIKKELS
jgi:hypothetical protein